MSSSNLLFLLQKAFDQPKPEIKDLVYLLSLSEETDKKSLFDFADFIRKQYIGDGILLRGMIEFSNYCRNTCAYCGLNKQNKKLIRYRLDEEEIMESVSRLAEALIKTVVLQSGEEDNLEPKWLEKIIRRIKSDYDIAVTLCVGERSEADYKRWRKAGADRYLLKIETADEKIYKKLHPKMSFKKRVNCLRTLKKLGFQTGSGNIIGLKGQGLETIAKDLLFFKEYAFEMIGIGPFIPHQATSLAAQPRGSVELTLKTVALARILNRKAHIPATTALGSFESDFRLDALKAGANVLMPNFTPLEYKKLYEIYPDKRCVTEDAKSCVHCLEAKAKSIARFIDYGRGDSLK